MIKDKDAVIGNLFFHEEIREEFDCGKSKVIKKAGPYPFTKWDFANYAQGTFHGSPIPLDQEWLKRLGFKHAKSDSDNYWQADYWYIAGKEDIQILQQEGDFYLMGYDWQEGIKAIYFVHSLQNLFYALTGQELKINEDGVG